MKSSGFFNKVYALVALIPPGKVMTYGQIARVLHSPRSAKVVGYAVSSAPDFSPLPCHRVVNRLGEMAPGLVFGGQKVQRDLLQSEGVPFLANGRINLEQALYEPEILPEDDNKDDNEELMFQSRKTSSERGRKRTPKT